MAKNSFLRFLFPYSYIFNLDWNTLVPVMLSAIIVGIAVAIFKRMDYKMSVIEINNWRNPTGQRMSCGGAEFNVKRVNLGG